VTAVLPRVRRAGRAVVALAGCAFAGLATAASAATSVTAATGAWTVDPAASRFTFSATMSGGEFQGSFGTYTADIVFDPADLAGSRFKVVVSTASARTGDAERDTALVGPEFFATSQWNSATWVADRFEGAGPGRWVAHGRLALRGVTRNQDVAFTFVEQPAAGKARLAGTALVRRLDYGIGQGDWQDTSVLANEVRLSFDLVLQRE
jgi:polyisoprenoid-binding protein YceI